MLDALHTWSQFPECLSAIQTVHLVETSQMMRELQKEKITKSKSEKLSQVSVSWHDSIEEILEQEVDEENEEGQDQALAVADEAEVYDRHWGNEPAALTEAARAAVERRAWEKRATKDGVVEVPEGTALPAEDAPLHLEAAMSAYRDALVVDTSRAGSSRNSVARHALTHVLRCVLVTNTSLHRSFGPGNASACSRTPNLSPKTPTGHCRISHSPAPLSSSSAPSAPLHSCGSTRSPLPACCPKATAYLAAIATA